jgi:hypothetical protein
MIRDASKGSPRELAIRPSSAYETQKQQELPAAAGHLAASLWFSMTTRYGKQHIGSMIGRHLL